MRTISDRVTTVYDSLWVTDGAQKCVFLTLNLHQPILTNIKQIYSVKICIFLHII